MISFLPPPTFCIRETNNMQQECNFCNSKVRVGQYSESTKVFQGSNCVVAWKVTPLFIMLWLPISHSMHVSNHNKKSRLHFHEPNFETLLDIDKKFEYWNWMPFNLFNFLIILDVHSCDGFLQPMHIKGTKKCLHKFFILVEEYIVFTKFCYIVKYVFINSYHFKGVYLYSNLVKKVLA